MAHAVSLSVDGGVVVPAERPDTPPPDSVSLYWLGQAGFLIDTAALRIVIDPYLSDSLAEKYRGTRFPHTRMMPPPLDPTELAGVDWVLATHGHTDHLDPGTLPAIARNNPHCRFLVPRSVREKALERGVPADRMVECNSGQTVELPALQRASRTGGTPTPGSGTGTEEAPAHVSVVPAAHEERERDAQGNDRYLGYVISLRVAPSAGNSGLEAGPLAGAVSAAVVAGPAGAEDEAADRRGASDGGRRDVAREWLTVYHSGDTVPFEELFEVLAGYRMDLALLPINGRDEERRSHGVPGNMTVDEAVDAVERLRIPYLIAHHLDLFDFNTVDRQWAERRIAERSIGGHSTERFGRLRIASEGCRYELSVSSGGSGS